MGKKDGSWRLCVDYKKLNKQAIKDKYLIPLHEDLLDELGGSCIYSKLDLQLGYISSECINLIFSKQRSRPTLVTTNIWSIEEHLQHLATVFQLLRANTLLLKRSKCAFAASRIEYLGHYISAEGVSTDPTKIQAVLDWPTLITLKQLQGFLGLTNYYRRFVKNYGLLARPLTDLLKKDNFQWGAIAEKAFFEFKQALNYYSSINSS